MSDPSRLLDAILRADFASFLRKAFDTVSPGDTFAPNWHLDAIAWRLGDVRDGATRRLIVTMPPRCLKSITISVAWVAWMLGHDPAKRFVCVSYSSDLALKHARDCRAIMHSEWYRRIFPGTVVPHGGGGDLDFRTTRGGGRFSTSVGGTLTGRGGDIIVIDDPIKPEEAMSEATRSTVLRWYSNTLLSRLNDKARGAIVLVMQRLHEEDLAGHLLEGGNWDHLNLPAIAEADEAIPIGPGRIHGRSPRDVLHPAREPLERLQEARRVMGSAVFSAQYQQAPVPAEGALVKRAWLRHYRQLPERRPGDQIVQSWDTATKAGVMNDWSVCITALRRGRETWLLDVFRERLEFPELRRKVIELARRFDARALLVEDAASGAQLIQQLRAELPAGVPRPIARKPEADKTTRLAGQSARIEAGELLLPEEAPWLDLFMRELLGFPNGRHDDQVDALAQLLAWDGARQAMIAVHGCQVIELENSSDYLDGLF